MEPQLGCAMQLVRFVAVRSALHGVGLDGGLLQKPGVCDGRWPFHFRPGSRRPVEADRRGASASWRVGDFRRWRWLTPWPPWPEHWISSGMAIAANQSARGEDRRVYRCRCGRVRSIAVFLSRASSLIRRCAEAIEAFDEKEITL